LEIYEARGINLLVIEAGRVQWLDSKLDEGLGQELAKREGVRHVSGMMASMISFDEYDVFGVLVRGMPTDSFVLDKIHVIAGRQLQADDERVVMLGASLADGLNKKVGDTVQVVDEPFKVVGVFESKNVFENGSMIMPLAELQRLEYREEEVTLFNIVAEHGDRQSIESLRDDIQNELPKATPLAKNLKAVPTREFVDTAVEIRLARSVAWLTSTIALVVGTIGMINTMLTAVFERTQELALLRAIGWRKGTVIRMIMLESMLLGMIGAVLGTLAAIGLNKFLSVLPASEHLVAGDVSAGVVLQGFAVAVVVGLAGGLFPAYRAARLAPTDGLRHE
jgi:putative ABC transport system permease protein